MEENTNVVNNSTTQEKEGSKFGWGVLGFFIPLVGLILFLVWMKDKKRAAKAAGIGALIGFIFSIISTVLLVTIFGAVLGIGLSEYDNNKGNYNPTPIVEEDTNNEEEKGEIVNNSCELGLEKIKNPSDRKYELEKKYGYKVTLNGKCSEYIVKDNNKELFSIVEEQKESRNSYKLNIKNDSIDIAGLNNYKYDTEQKKDVFKDVDFKYYKVNNIIIFVLGYSYPVTTNVYLYDIENGNYVKVERNLGNDKFPLTFSDLEIDDRKNIIIKWRLYNSSGFEGMRDDPRVKILLRVVNMEEFDIEQELSNYGIGDFPYEQGYYYKDASSSKPYDVSVTKTITEFYNEIMSKKKNGD